MRFADAMKPSGPSDGSRDVWSSAKVATTLHAIEQGYQVPSPFYEGKPEWRKGNIVFEYTDHEMEELRKCARDIVYFANKYCHVMTDEGYRQIVLRDYQEDTLRTYQHNRFTIFLSARQTGKTIVTGIFLTWFLLFHFDKNAMLMANKGDTSKEIMQKIKAIMEGLPFFMKPGVVKNDVYSMAFDNRCTITAGTTTKRSGIGFTIHLLFLDEFAHVPENIKNEFYENIFPTLSSSKISRIVITSTPNGHDLFHKLYQDAIAEPKRNTYVAIKVDWWQVPGRDDAWKRDQVANLGSEEAFNVQFGCSFQQSSRMLLGAAELERLVAQSREYVVREHEALDDLGVDHTAMRWDPDFDMDELKNGGEFVLTVDLAEGVGRDYSVINVFKMTAVGDEDMRKVTSPGSVKEFFGFRQVGVFRHNKYAVEEVAKVVYALMVKMIHPERVRLVLEANVYGNELVKDLMSIYPLDNHFDEGTVVKYKHRAEATHKRYGFKFGAETKKVYCEKTKRLISSGRMLLTDQKTAKEFQYFSRNANGTYSAQAGHDDLCMSAVLGSTFFDTIEYTDAVLETMERLSEETAAYIQGAVDGVDTVGGDSDPTGLGALFGGEGGHTGVDPDSFGLL